MRMAVTWVRGLAGALSAIWLCTAVWAQPVPANVAVPFYTPDHFVQGLYRGALAPRAKAMAQEGAALAAALRGYCAMPPAQAQAAIAAVRVAWADAAQRWDGLSAVAVGPVLSRRTQRQIDFTPTRPALIERAIQAAPASAADMERVGTPAKGFPALEWLLWTQAVQPATPACQYAVQVATDLAREADALGAAFTTDAARDWSDEDSTAAMGEVINQWVGGLERLRWAQMEKPLREAQSKNSGEAQSRKPTAPQFPRLASGQTAAGWTAQWEAISAVAIARTATLPQPGTRLVPLETYLRGRGLNPLADKLRQAVQRVDQTMLALKPASAASVLASARALSALKRLAEAELAPALQVNIGFSDADGD